MSGARAEPRPAFDLAAFLRRERGRVEAALARSAARWERTLPGALAEAAGHGVGGGGKRLRPVLCAAAYHACGGPSGEPFYDLAASVELVHAYSLMHDDLPCMDDAELRRGRPATHRLHGQAATMIAGAALIPLAVLHVLEAAAAMGLPRDRGCAVARELCRAAGAGGMVGGQVLDLLAEGRTLEGAELDVLHGLKTGALLTAALRMGAVAAGAPEPVVAALDRYGRSVGLAFQIADDVLDATATAQALGKEPSDAALGKSTYVSLHGLEAARLRALAEVARAREALEGVGLDGTEAAVSALHALAGYVAERSR